MYTPFFALDSCDGAGKTTACDMLESILRAKGIDVMRLKGLGNSKLTLSIREAFLEDSGELSSTERNLGIALSLAEASRLANRYLGEGKAVICDRYIPSFFAYQVKLLKYPKSLAILEEILHDQALMSSFPSHFLLLKCNSQTISQRLELRQGKNWLDNSSIDYIEKLQSYFEDYFTTYQQKKIDLYTDSGLDDLKAQLERIVN